MGDQAGTPSQASPEHTMRPWSQFPCNCLDLSTESPTSQATPQSSHISPGISVHLPACHSHELPVLQLPQSAKGARWCEPEARSRL